MFKYLETLFRYRLLFAVLGLLLPVAGSALSIVLFPAVTARASLWVETPNFYGLSPAATVAWNQYLTPAQNTVDGMSQLVKTDAFAHQLAARLDASQAFSSPSERSETLAAVPSSLRIGFSGSHLVTMTFTCRRAPLCVKVLSEVISIYRQTLTQQQQAQAQAAMDFYQSQLKKAQEDLKNDQGALAQYMAAHPQIKPGDVPLIPEADQLARQVTTDQDQVRSLQAKLDGIRFTASAANEINNSVVTLIDPPTPLRGGHLSSLPKRQLAFVWVFALGIAGALLGLLTWLDRSARDPRELERRLQVPVLAEIPALRASERVA